MVIKLDAVTVQATYDPQTITSTEVQRMLYQLAHIIEQIGIHPETPIKDMGGVSPEEGINQVKCSLQMAKPMR
jgi:hypothetical protein